MMAITLKDTLEATVLLSPGRFSNKVKQTKKGSISTPLLAPQLQEVGFEEAEGWEYSKMRQTTSESDTSDRTGRDTWSTTDATGIGAKNREYSLW